LPAGSPGGGAPPGRWLAVPAFVALMVFFPPIESNMIQGQINPLVLFCTAMFFCCYARQRSARTPRNEDAQRAAGPATQGMPPHGQRAAHKVRRPQAAVWAGAWLAAAIAIKIVPAVLLLFLAVRKEYRILLWTFLFTGLFFLLPAVVAGRDLPAYYRSYVDGFVWPSLTRPLANSPTHFSLQGTVGCFLPGVPLGWRKAVCSLAVLVGVLAVERAAARSGDARRDVWPFCAYLVACLLLSPVVELHHLVLAAPAVFLLVVKAFFDRAWTTPTVLSCLGAFVLCFDVAARWDGTKLSCFAGLAILLALLYLAAAENRRRFSP
jgi:hypothetical protein